MARYIVEQQISEPEQLKQFDYEGYYFDPISSSADEWVFKRDHSA